MKDFSIDDIKQIMNILNHLSTATGEYYYLIDIANDIINFSSNISNLCEIQDTLKIDAWRKKIYQYDFNKVVSNYRHLKKDITKEYDINFRIIGHNGMQWVNSRGKIFTSNITKKRYLLGRLSTVDTSATTHNLQTIKRNLKQAINKHEKGYFIIFGIDDLKNINLQYGRKIGDSIINDLYKTIKDEISESPVQRIGSDVFGAIIPKKTSKEVNKIYEAIKNRMKEQCAISAGSVSLDKYYTNDENDLLQYAETALYYAKMKGKNNLHFFNSDDYEKILKELEIVEELKRNIRNNFNGFQIFYQPLVANYTYEIVGAEALLRYICDNGDKLSTQYLVSLLEKYDLIYEVGLWILDNTCSQGMLWRQHIKNFNMHVNMSLAQLSTNKLHKELLAIINKYTFLDFLTIELTESVELYNYPYLNDIINIWKTKGIKIAIDDFGTGYSSLSRLQQLTIDEIKIDKSFVHNMHENIYNAKLVKNIIDFAKTFEINVCCEGVETINEVKALSKIKNAQTLQGYFFSTPLSANAFTNQFINDPNPFNNLLDD